MTRRQLLWILVAAPLALLLISGVSAALIWSQLPELDQLTDYQPRQPLRVLSEEGQLLGEFGAERRRFVPLDEIPKPLQDALLAVEDSDFWNHAGLDYSGILRAALHNLTHSGPRQGASTITQQLARDTYLTKAQTWSRKFVEALLTVKIERVLSKQQILEIYMNQIFLGNKAYGFAAASERYFGKPLAKLDTAEIALLVGLPKDPVGLNPVSHFARAKRRQAVVLERLVAVGQITAAQAEAAKARELDIRQPRRLSGIADHAAEQVRAEIVARYGESAYTRGLSVITTLHYAEQAAAQESLRHALFELERRQPYRGPEAQVKLPEGEEGLDEALDAAFDAYPDLGELHTAVLLKVAKSGVLVAVSDGPRVPLKGNAPRALQNAKRGAVLRVLEAGSN
ncbi:MAG: penicillin-binding protein, partial [Roseateles sp.]